MVFFGHDCSEIDSVYRFLSLLITKDVADTFFNSAIDRMELLMEKHLMKHRDVY